MFYEWIPTNAPTFTGGWRFVKIEDEVHVEVAYEFQPIANVFTAKVIAYTNNQELIWSLHLPSFGCLVLEKPLIFQRRIDTPLRFVQNKNGRRSPSYKMLRDFCREASIYHTPRKIG